jgi:3-oxoacyl-[acyl-carrier-protein] synthase II
MSEWSGPSGRVVITGLGAVTPVGIGVEETWKGILAGKSGIDRVTLLDPTDYTTQIAGEVKDFHPENYVDAKEARRVDRFILFAVASASMALEDSGIDKASIAEDFGVLIGSGIGGLTFLAEQHRRQIEGGPSRVSPFLVPYMIADMASGYTSIVHGLKGPNSCVVTACSTGANAIGDAYHIIKRGDAIAMLAGGTEAPINELGMAGFCAARAMTTNNADPKGASRPFDKDRDGFIIAEGSSVFVLEDYAYAKARGAKIYGEIVGYGMSGDAYHITQPDSNASGAIRAMKMALRTAGMQPSDIGYINAHGTSTHYNDKLETKAIKEVFGASVPPVSSTKSMTGHPLGAAGAMEALFCLLAMRDSMLPPTTNYHTPDPECDLDYVPNVARSASVSACLSNSFGFGGHNVSLILKSLA